MSKQKRPPKRDWAKIKKDFFLSDFIEAKVFWRSLGRTWNGACSKATKGWQKEKRAWQDGIVQDALKKVREEQGEQLATALQNILKGIMSKTTSLDDMKMSSMKELGQIWRILRVENNLPTIITENTNKNENIELPVIFYPEEKKDDKEEEKGENKNENIS